MKGKLFKFELIGFVFSCILGTLAHFFYEWSANSVILSLFCPVNESVWEHLKLIFFPYLIWSAVEFFCAKDRKINLFFSKLCGILAGMTLIVFIYYTYTGATGNESITADIASFFIGTAAAYLISYTIIKNCSYKGKASEIISFIFLLLILGIFILFTFSPPLIPLFEDSVTKTYGI